MANQNSNPEYINPAISQTRLYGIYHGMKQRCYNPKNENYKTYGARGITICDEWLGENGLQNFIFWSINNGYNEDLTIDRKNNDKGYSPDNCQWVTRSFNSSKGNNDYEALIAYADAHMSTDKSKGETDGLTPKQVVKYYLARSGWTLTDVIAEYNKTHTPTTTQNISNKLSRGTLKYQEALDIAEIIGCRIVWEKK